MQELIYNIKDIFGKNQDSCLVQYSSERYHIPAYQRGYKWGAEKNEAVSVLLNDLWNAYKENLKEYYLQYITLKPCKVKVNGKPVKEDHLEVIDGQQRLTTLSILVSAFSSTLDKENISAHKLHYAIRENFFEEHIYSSDDFKQIVQKSWDELIEDPSYNKQDIFYLFSAAKKVHSFIQERTDKEKEAFFDYILSNVKLIVNSVEKHMNSETVFRNLNSNKVPLTEAELIKGLLVTKVGRNHEKEQMKNFREILEVRMNLGRQWDEISRWANRKEIKSFFFNGKEGMQQLLTLVALSLNLKVDKKADSKDFPLFNTYLRKKKEYLTIFTQIRDTYNLLKDWFENDKIYNLIGFCRFLKNSPNDDLAFLKRCLTKNKVELLSYLEEEKNKALQVEISDLKYGSNDEKIHAILLALNVFPKGQERRFDFYAFDSEDWSLEHIFPQSPEGKNLTLTTSQKDEIRIMLDDQLIPKIDKILKKESRTEEEKQVYYKALQNSKYLNSIGNMCLLTKGDNSSNGCMFFYDKRTNILNLIQRGSFVPKHTFDVFSKMIRGLEESSIKTWTKNDIEVHTNYIKDMFIKPNNSEVK